MGLSPHLRAALIITVGATAFAGLLVTRLLSAMMVDPNFGRGDNLFELVALMTCVLGPVLALVAAVGLAFRQRWAMRVGRGAAWVLLAAAFAILANFAIAGGAETGQSGALAATQTAVGVASLAGAVGLYFLLRSLPKPSLAARSRPWWRVGLYFLLRLLPKR